jgi:oxygen-independent coproporphyrinogen-3 oxidase
VPELIVGSIQWGGGTPSQLGTVNIAEVAKRLAARFDRRCGSETSMEVDPRFCDEALVATMRDIGVDRASLGVQDFDIGVQQAINRLQSVDDTAMAISRLRAAGIARINLDLVYGLPRQTLETLARTLDAALELAPDRFAVFAYAHVPWMKARQRLIDPMSLPTASDRAAMVDLVARRLADGGYVQVGLDHYARPSDSLATAAQHGRLRRSFQGYVVEDQPSVVGLGASAISSLPRGYTQNAPDVCRRHDVSTGPFLEGIRALPALVEDGLVSRDGEKLHVTERGRPLVRFVCAAFDPHLKHVDGRHSRGI